MKKVLTIAAVAFLSLAAFGKFAEDTDSEATGHLDWDSTDQVYRCVGSAINCDFET